MFEEYIGQFIKIATKNGFMFHGKLISVDGSFLILEDRFDGKKIISIDSVSDFSLWGVSK